MMRYGWGLLALAALAGCSDAALPFDAREAAPRLAATGVDADRDGLDDGTEMDLATRFAPVLYLPNLIAEGSTVNGDWTRPASVPWYLSRVRMRIHHNNCSDHQLLDFGAVTAATLLQQRHQRYTLGLFGCSHKDPVQYSNGSWHPDDHYFLQQNDSTHRGLPETDPSKWPVYFHAYRNTAGGVSIQYWFFYAYNDGVSGFNHEGDWEHVNVKLDAANNPLTVYFSAHNGLSAYTPADVAWFGGTHPKVWVADGSHANYRSESACDGTVVEGAYSSCWTLDGNRWFTWTGGKGTNAGFQGGGLVNVGSREYPMAGQGWIQYSGRWGEVGNSDDTSGPCGPAYNKNKWWNTDAATWSGPLEPCKV
jgi:hypothetical protein